MLKVFEICFGTGAIFTVISFLLGHVLHIGHTDVGNADVGGIDANLDTSIDLSSGDAGIELGGHSDGFFTALKPTIILSFITTFGGIGIISLRNGFSNAISTAIAILIAFIISFSINRFIIVPLNKAQNTSAISQKKLKGNLGKLAVGISGNGFGRVNYTVGGNSYNSPAKSYDGKDIEKGSDVMIIEIKNRVFYVKRFYYEKIDYGFKDE